MTVKLLEVTKVCSGHSLKLQVRMSWTSTVSQEVKLNRKSQWPTPLGVDLDCLSKLVMWRAALKSSENHGRGRPECKGLRSWFWDHCKNSDISKEIAPLQSFDQRTDMM